MSRFGFLSLYAPRGIVVRRVFCGVPKPPEGWFMPSRKAARLTNPWAYVAGSYYLLFKGLWRKALTFFLLLTLSRLMLPEAPEVLALERLLRDYYANALLTFLVGPVADSASSIWFMLIEPLPFAALDIGIVFALAGQKFIPCLLLPMAFIPFAIWHFLVPGIDLGVASSLVWILARHTWPLIVGIVMYAALAGRRILLMASLLIAFTLYVMGFPLQDLSFQAIATVSLHLMLAFMTELDLYRRNVLRLRFWW